MSDDVIKPAEDHAGPDLNTMSREEILAYAEKLASEPLPEPTPPAIEDDEVVEVEAPKPAKGRSGVIIVLSICLGLLAIEGAVWAWRKDFYSTIKRNIPEISLPSLPNFGGSDEPAATVEKLDDPEKIVDAKQQVLDLIVKYIQVSRKAAIEAGKRRPNIKTEQKLADQKLEIRLQIQAIYGKLRAKDVTASMRRFVETRLK